MRTTLTLEPDVAAQIERLKRKRGGSLKSLINDLLRQGLRSQEGEPAPNHEGPYTRVLHAGEPLIPIDNVAEAISIAEGDDHQ